MTCVKGLFITYLTASDGAANDQFGGSVAISGEILVIGASQDDVGANSDQGSATVFACTSPQMWVQQSNLTAPDGAANDQFGKSVAISGETAVIGMPEDDITLVGEGSVYVFVQTGTTWSFQQKLTIPFGQVTDLFGTSVAISGETLVAGAILRDISSNSDQGAVYVFERIGTTWTRTQQLTATGGAVNDQFGQSVAIDGQTLVVGAPLDDVGGNTDQGSATVFVRSGTTWTQQQQLTATGGAANDRFGVVVAISGNTVVVGSPLDDVGANSNQGSATVFVRSGTTWTQQQQLTATGSAMSDDQFGASVAISGETVVVGAPLENVGGNADQGSAYVFVRSGTSWTQQQQLTASNGTTGDQFGFSVAIQGDTVVVGANLDDVGANTDQGSAYVFVRNGTAWTQRQQLTAANGAAQDQFGFSVAIASANLVVGAFIDDVGANSNQGSVYVYRLDCVICPTITGTVTGGGTICSGSNSTVTVTISGGTPPYSNVAINGAPAQNGTTGQTVFNFSVNPSVTTVYTLQSGSDSIGCPITGSGSATVTVNQLPTTANAGPDQMLLCTSSPTTTLAGNTPGVGSGQWSVVTAPAGGSTNSTQFSNTGSPTTAFTPNPGKIGTYILQWAITNSFCTPSTDTVAIIYRDPPTTANAGSDQTLCTSSPTATVLAGSLAVGSGQ